MKKLYKVLTHSLRILFFGCTAVFLQNAGAMEPANAIEGPRHFNIVDFGAVPDGKTINTSAIQETIEHAARAGGGVVEITSGTFRSGSIFLRQNVELHLADGAVLLGSNRIEDYPKIPTRIEGHTEPWRMALVNAQNLSGVRITGKGRLDGNGILFWAAFWQRRKENPGCTNLEVERPRLLFVDRCQLVNLSGFSLQDSGFWNLHLYLCHDVVIEGLRITAPTAGHILGPSTDGIDIDSCQNVTIRKCFISVNDDNIALKGSKGPHADRDTASPPVENILIEDCEFKDGNGLITCGSEATVVNHVTARHCVISGRANLLTLKLRPDTPQHYENILVEDIELNGTGKILNMGPWNQFFDLQGAAPPSSLVEHITLRNIHGSFGSMVSLIGTERTEIRDISLIDIHLTLANADIHVGKVENFIVENVQLNGKAITGPFTSDRGQNSYSRRGSQQR